MMTPRHRDSRDVVAIGLAATVAVFVLSTLVIVFVLALRGIGLPEVWDALFGLIIAVMSALGGWMLGRTNNRPPPSEGPPL